MRLAFRVRRRDLLKSSDIEDCEQLRRPDGTYVCDVAHDWGIRGSASGAEKSACLEIEADLLNLFQDDGVSVDADVRAKPS